MKTLSIIAVMIAAMTGGGAESRATSISGPIFNPATGHNYYLLENSIWADAQSQALSLGGNLVTINDAAENAWVVSTFASFGGQPRNLWIGLTPGTASGNVPSNYFWVSGETSTFRNWAPGEPNFSDEKFVYILGPGIPVSGKWNNYYDSTSTPPYSGGGQTLPALNNYGVVEVVPEPSARILVVVSLGVGIGLTQFRRLRNC